jgi:hypothetical protein
MQKETVNPNSAVEREVMSKEQTFHREDNAFCLWEGGAVSALRNDGKQMELRAGAKKDFETNRRVSSLLQVCPSLTF